MGTATLFYTKRVAIEVLQIPILNDNFIYVLHNDVSHHAVIIDPGLIDPVLEAIPSDCPVVAILNTHHHWDHTDGNEALKEHFECPVYGFAEDQHRLPGLTHPLKDNESLHLLGETVLVKHTPGHTSGHICYYFEDSKILLCGDTLFRYGCGRLFEGTATQMKQSLDWIRQLPEDTQVLCTHEYTRDNLRFCMSLDYDNAHYKRALEQLGLEKKGHPPSVPFLLKEQLQHNPFLKWDDPQLQNIMGDSLQDEETFARLRQKKDQFTYGGV